MKIAVIGGGINGLMIARQLSLDSHKVFLFEKDELMSGTSSKSTKLIHGGIRYLENLQFKQVKESLIERDFWLNYAPEIVKPIEFIIPIYSSSLRQKWRYKLGLFIYDFLASKKNIAQHQRLTRNQIIENEPNLKDHEIISGYSFYDAQMDDFTLGLYVADELEKLGVKIFTQKEVKDIDPIGELTFMDSSKMSFDKIFNVTGPHAERILKKSNINSSLKIDLIRGSHIIFNQPINKSYLFEAQDSRIFFVISYKNKTLVGTTEVKQELDEAIKPSLDEIKYLLDAYNKFFICNKNASDIDDYYSGVRPLIKSYRSPTNTSREYDFEIINNLISVFGGKWTSSRALAKKCSRLF